jgi:protease I
VDATNGFPLITSRTPDDLPAFNRELLAALGVAD